jgi:DNA-binding protein HU-beta/integration host factor subunit beta
MRNIVKKDLVTDVAARTGISEGRVKDVAEAFMGQIATYLSHNRTIELRGFGTFSCRRRKGRPALNPRTKAIVRIPDRLVPVLRFSEAVKARVAAKEVV